MQKHWTKPVRHRSGCRRVVQQCGVVGEFLGYARVATAEQTAVLQEDALRAAGCSRIWSDTASAAILGRGSIDPLQLQPGDGVSVVGFPY